MRTVSDVFKFHRPKKKAPENKCKEGGHDPGKDSCCSLLVTTGWIRGLVIGDSNK